VTKLLEFKLSPRSAAEHPLKIDGTSEGFCRERQQLIHIHLKPSNIPKMISSIPSLRLRKDIWTHFPVCLIKMPYDTDGRDRYAIQWHQKNLTEWSQGIPQYPTITQLRLLRALKSCDKWNLETPKNPADLCVIAMNFSEEPKQFETLPDIYSSAPTPTKIDDLKKFFPVCWKVRQNAYHLEFHNTQVRALAEKHGVPEVEIERLTRQGLVRCLGDPKWELKMSAKMHSREIGVVSRC
jgi:hypothetical protein